MKVPVSFPSIVLYRDCADEIKCSGGRPCITCAQATFSARASSYLWLRSCVPSALADLKKFFKAGKETIRSASLLPFSH